MCGYYNDPKYYKPYQAELDFRMGRLDQLQLKIPVHDPYGRSPMISACQQPESPYRVDPYARGWKFSLMHD